MAVSSGTQWLLAVHTGRQLRAEPADELAALDTARARAEASGDVERVAAIDEQLDGLFASAREQEAERTRESAANMRFSSGTRRPLPRPKPSANQQMDELLLAKYQNRGL